jgi:hypothetical protein
MTHRMCRLIAVSSLVLLTLSTGALAGEETFGGARLVVLKGSHYQRGVAHGTALHAEIIDLVDNYLAQKVAVPQFFFAMLRQVAPLIKVDAGLEQEARGIVEGARTAGGGSFRSRYQDADFTWQEMIALNTYVDYIGTACSSVSAWGEATAGTPLEGESILARNLDWSLAPELLRNQVIFVNLPSEEDEQPFISVGFAGFIGCLSCVNAGHLGAFLNLGYGDKSGRYPPTTEFVPAALAFRLAMEARGPSKGGPLEAFVRALTSHHHVGSFIIHAIVPASVTGDPALVVELQTDTHEVRYARDDARLKVPTLIATNHNRKGTSPRSCRRYRKARERAALLGREVTPQALWETLAAMRRDDTMQRMLFVPSTGEFWLSVRRPADRPDRGPRTLFEQPFAAVEKTTFEALLTR